MGVTVVLPSIAQTVMFVSSGTPSLAVSLLLPVPLPIVSLPVDINARVCVYLRVSLRFW
jgi:hypothetical protein